jgi:pSer/pThr/pTyr-binding forkhead associated (FHA) protein
MLIGRFDASIGGVQPDIDLAFLPGSNSVSRIHAALDHIGNAYTITDLNSTNATYINEQKLEPNRASLIMDGDIIAFGTINSLFHKA